MRILLSGEGATDYGKIEYGTSGHILEGPIQAYIRNIIKLSLPEENVEIDFFNRKEVDKVPLKLGRRRLSEGHPHGHGILARYLYLEGWRQHYDIVAFYLDADNNNGPSNTKESACRKHYNELKEEVLSGFLSEEEICGIAIIPMKTIESWILADPDSFKVVVSDDISEKIFPNKPELTWGNENDPKSNFPKNIISRILQPYGLKADQELFYELAEVANLDTLVSNCPISFAPFMQDLSYVVCMYDHQNLSLL